MSTLAVTPWDYTLICFTSNHQTLQSIPIMSDMSLGVSIIIIECDFDSTNYLLSVSDNLNWSQLLCFLEQESNPNQSDYRATSEYTMTDTPWDYAVICFYV